MTILEFSFTILSKGFGDIIDITGKIESFLANLNSNYAIVYIYNDSNNVTIRNIEIKELEKKMKDINYKKSLQISNNNMIILPIIDKKLYKSEISRILFIDFEQNVIERKIVIMLQT